MLILILLGAPLLASAQFRPDRAEYIWPTDASRYMSGTFAETRSRHFHSALDIKTWGQRGYRIYATRSGILYRFAIGPGGYGKVIYLKHPDGSYSVYAHLLSFAERIQELADSIRFRDYSHEIDIVVDSLEIPVSQGEVIGYSGATGVGPPHLHFELRTPSEKPFNPLLTNLSVSDSRPPQFSALSVEPLEPGSRIEGEKKIYIKRSMPGEGRYDFGTIDVKGAVGLGVDVFDMADRVSNAYAVYDLKLYMDKELLFHSRVDSFSYDETSQMFLDRVYPVLKRSGRGFQRLFRVDGNDLPFYQKMKNNGKIDLPEGSHRLRIVAEDYFGNRSEARLILNVGRLNQQFGSAGSSGSNGSNGSNGTNGQDEEDPNPGRWRWHPDWIDFNGNGARNFLVTAIDASSRSLVPLRVRTDSHIRLGKYDMISIHRPDTPFPLHLYRVQPGSSATVHASGLNAYARFPQGTFYDTLSVAVSGTIYGPDSVKVHLYPDDQPIRREFELTYILGKSQAGDTTLAFYAYNDRRDKFSYIPTRRGGTVLKGQAETLGTYFVLADHEPPRLYRPRIFRRKDGNWVASVRVEDKRSGLDPAFTRFYINGVRGIAEYEPEDDRILYYHPDFGPSSQYRLQIVARDRAGNRTEKEFRIR